MIQKPKCTIQNHNLRFRNQNLAATPSDHIWPLCCILNFTRDQSPATPSDHYVACWTSQEIKAPPRPLTTMLHVELHKRSIPRRALWPLCCMLNFTKKSKPRHALRPLCCMLNFTRDQSPATPSDHFVPDAQLIAPYKTGNKHTHCVQHTGHHRSMANQNFSR